MEELKTSMSWSFMENKLREIIREELESSSNNVLLTRDQACDFLQCSSTTLYYHMRDGGLPYSRLGRKLLFSKAALIEFISVKTKTQKNEA